MEYFKHLFDNYYVSENSNIYDCNKDVFLTETINQGGYLVVWLMHNGKRKQFKHHRCVALAWLPNPRGLKFVNHINGIKYDNAIINLEWCTHKENIKHALKSGLFSGRTPIAKETIQAQARRAIRRPFKTIKITIAFHIFQELTQIAANKGLDNTACYIENVLNEHCYNKKQP